MIKNLTSTKRSYAKSPIRHLLTSPKNGLFFDLSGFQRLINTFFLPWSELLPCIHEPRAKQLAQRKTKNGCFITVW